MNSEEQNRTRSYAEFEARRKKRRKRRIRRRRLITLTTFLTVIIAGVIIFSIVSSINSDENTPSNSPDEIDLIGGTSEDAADTFELMSEPTPEPTPENTLALETNDLLKIATNASTDTEKVCYLTFDDGPTNSITPLILDILRKYNIKATFFEVGSLIESNPSMARRVYDEGHLIGNHSYTHTYSKVYADTDAFMSEINKTFELIEGVCGTDNIFRLTRFPGGSYNAGSYASVKQDCKEVLAENGIYYCDWNALNGDAEGKSKNSQELYEYFVDNASFSKNLVVLMHDASGKNETPASLELVIQRLISEGYTFKRLDEAI